MTLGGTENDSSRQEDRCVRWARELRGSNMSGLGGNTAQPACSGVRPNSNLAKGLAT